MVLFPPLHSLFGKTIQYETMNEERDEEEKANNREHKTKVNLNKNMCPLIYEAIGKILYRETEAMR